MVCVGGLHTRREHRDGYILLDLFDSLMFLFDSVQCRLQITSRCIGKPFAVRNAIDPFLSTFNPSSSRSSAARSRIAR
jgi:hypothetical protein